MKIATWNVNSLRVRLPHLLDWLAQEQPDVVGLQELKCTDAQFPFAELAAAGYQAAVNGQKTYNGVAMGTADRNHNQRVLVQTKAAMAAYRGAPGGNAAPVVASIPEPSTTGSIAPAREAASSGPSTRTHGRFARPSRVACTNCRSCSATTTPLRTGPASGTTSTSPTSRCATCAARAPRWTRRAGRAWPR